MHIKHWGNELAGFPCVYLSPIAFYDCLLKIYDVWGLLCAKEENLTGALPWGPCFACLFNSLVVVSVIKNAPPSLTVRWDCGLTARANSGP